MRNPQYRVGRLVEYRGMVMRVVASEWRDGCRWYDVVDADGSKQGVHLKGIGEVCLREIPEWRLGNG